MTDRITELRALHESATDGEWHAPGLGEVHDEDHRIIALCIDCEPVGPGEVHFPSLEHGERIAKAIVASVNAVPALLDCAEALQKLTFVARTSGGTAGRDEDLVAACEQAEAALRALNGDDHD